MKNTKTHIAKLHFLNFIIVVFAMIVGSVVFVCDLPLQFIFHQEAFYRKCITGLNEQLRKTLLPLYIFDSHGLLHNISHLNTLSCDLKKVLKEMSLEQMSNYVDEVVFDYVNKGKNTALVANNLNRHKDNSILMDKLNMTALGNLAYLFLHSKDDVESKIAFEQLKVIRENLGVQI